MCVALYTKVIDSVCNCVYMTKTCMCKLRGKSCSWYVPQIMSNEALTNCIGLIIRFVHMVLGAYTCIVSFLHSYLLSVVENWL